MTRMMKAAMAAALALPVLAATAPEASAQNAAACTNRVFINPIHVSGSSFVNGQNAFEYSLQVQNQSQQARFVTICFHGFPRDVTLSSPTLAPVRLDPYQQQTIKFGNGTNNNITLSTVGVMQDQTAGRNPYVRLSRCSPA